MSDFDVGAWQPPFLTISGVPLRYALRLSSWTQNFEPLLTNCLHPQGRTCWMQCFKMYTWEGQIFSLRWPGNVDLDVKCGYCLIFCESLRFAKCHPWHGLLSHNCLRPRPCRSHSHSCPHLHSHPHSPPLNLACQYEVISLPELVTLAAFSYVPRSCDDCWGIAWPAQLLPNHSETSSSRAEGDVPARR